MVNEVYLSIQGESTRAGLPCVFVRLTGCHLRCHYCDSAYAFYEGTRRNVPELIDQVAGYKCDLVEVTGGEPLLQPGVHELMTGLCDAGHTVLVETSGACDISSCDPRVIRIVDLKTPGSGEADKNLWDNVGHLRARDEVKFVLCDRGDYEWARGVVEEHGLVDRVGAVLMSPAHPITDDGDGQVRGVRGLGLRELAGWIAEDRIPVRLQVQLHKFIWDPSERGV